MKAKAQTLAQRFGFQDKQLTTPVHDQLVLWVEENILKVVGSKGRVLKLILEKPITQARSDYGGRGSSYIIGFVDVMVEICNHKDSCLHNSMISESNECVHRTFYIEVKPVIESFGELLRQLQMYKTYVDWRATFLVASPDTNFADSIRRQGIEFYKIPTFMNGAEEACGALMFDYLASEPRAKGDHGNEGCDRLSNDQYRKHQ